MREAVLNHKKKGLRGVYNLYEYDREKQEASARMDPAHERAPAGD